MGAFSPLLIMSSSPSKSSHEEIEPTDEDAIQLVKPLLPRHVDWEILQNRADIGNVNPVINWLRVSYSHCTNVPHKGFGNAMRKD